MSTPEGPIVVIGAGMAGLGAATTLRRAGHEVIVLERMPVVGGLARTVAFDDHIFDVGPHYFFLDVSDAVNELVKSCVTEEEWRPIDFKISTYIGKHHVPWPPTLKSVFKLPPTAMLQYLRNALAGRVPKQYVASEFLQGVYGKVIYKIFLDPYLKKKVPTSDGPAQLHRDWYNQTARTIHNVPDVLRDKMLQVEPDVVKQYMSRYPEVEKRLAEEKAQREAEEQQNDKQVKEATGIRRVFKIVGGLTRSVTATNYKKVLYPPGGVGVITERVAEEYERIGGTLHLKASNVDLHREGNRVSKVTWDGGEIENPREVIWTGSIHRLCSMMDIAREELPFMTIVLGMMKLKRELPKDEELYTYVADPDIVFNRIYYPTRSVPGLAPPGKDSLCVEITPTDQRMETMPEHVYDNIVAGLEKLGVCTRDDIEDIEYMFVADSYPVYPVDYREKLDRIWAEHDKFDNLRSIGRSGQFWYNNMARSMRAGVETANDILGTYEP